MSNILLVSLLSSLNVLVSASNRAHRVSDLNEFVDEASTSLNSQTLDHGTSQPINDPIAIPAKSWRQATDNIQEDHFSRHLRLPPSSPGHVAFGGNVGLYDTADSWTNIDADIGCGPTSFEEGAEGSQSRISHDGYVLVEASETSRQTVSAAYSSAEGISDQQSMNHLFEYWDRCRINLRMLPEALADGVDSMQTGNLPPETMTKCMVAYLRRRQADAGYIAAFENHREGIALHRALIKDQKRRALQKALRKMKN